MEDALEKISLFLSEHHVLSLATTADDEISVCSLFYTFNKEKVSFVVASSDETRHVQHCLKNANIAGNILLETKTVGKIQGVQFHGVFLPLEDAELKIQYFKSFPYALALNPKLWQIEVNYFKMTDNRLGFGNKIIWQK
ncbi:MAG: hypothetical protein NTZ60_08050 [Campylobacterales bacterium]|nr:hypothetical protein [Campylobacterales bacterium]